MYTTQIKLKSSFADQWLIVSVTQMTLPDVGVKYKISSLFYLIQQMRREWLPRRRAPMISHIRSIRWFNSSPWPHKGRTRSDHPAQPVVTTSPAPPTPIPYSRNACYYLRKDEQKFPDALSFFDSQSEVAWRSRYAIENDRSPQMSLFIEFNLWDILPSKAAYHASKNFLVRKTGLKSLFVRTVRGGRETTKNYNQPHRCLYVL